MKDKFNFINWVEDNWMKLAVIVGILAISTVFFTGCCMSEVDSYEMGYRYDARNGQITHLNRAGYFIHAPFVIKINSVDLRPMQVCINANSRVLNCKLVQFNPAGLDLFLSWHGRDNYTAGTLNPILMSYAYDGSGRNYPFLTIIRELKNEEIVEPIVK